MFLKDSYAFICYLVEFFKLQSQRKDYWNIPEIKAIKEP